MRKLYLLALSACIFSLGINAQDTCEDALPIELGIYEVEAIDGTEIPLPICTTNGEGAEGGEWYSFTHEEDVQITVSTDLAINNGGDTRFHVYSGECGNLTCVGGDDDSGNGYLSVGSFNAEAGETYYIAFDDRWSSEGFIFEVEATELVEGAITFSNQSVNTSGTMRGAFDMNNDQLDDVVSVSSNNVNLNLQQEDGSFETINISTPDANHTPSWSLCAGDIDNNGYNDLLYAGGSGVTFMFYNGEEEGFEEVSFDEYVFCQRSNMTDMDNDGHIDPFVCHDVQPNVYFTNDGEGNLTFNQGGLGDTPDGGNYGSIWVDYDNDGDSDLFIAKCRGGDSDANINQMHRNNGDGTFSEVSAAIGLEDNIQTWSSAWGDFDNDGDMDAMVGASTFSNGHHRLMENNDGIFTDVVEGSGIDNFMATSIEHVTHDFNNDGYLDILGGGNIILLGNGDMTFSQIDAGVGSGPVGDLNNDGFLDVVNGSTIKMNNGNDNNYIKIFTVGTASNLNGIGARVEVYTENLGKQIRDVRSGDGFRYMSSLTTHFGIGTAETVDSVKVIWPSGIVDHLYEEDLEINSTNTVVEGDFTIGVDEFGQQPQFTLYPNPVAEEIFIESELFGANSIVMIYDITGKKVMSEKADGNKLNLSSLETGTYILEVELDGQSVRKKFVKK
ncbi:FG-GAP-like repeat-containing protein [Halocola ammonii]